MQVAPFFVLILIMFTFTASISPAQSSCVRVFAEDPYPNRPYLTLMLEQQYSLFLEGNRTLNGRVIDMKTDETGTVYVLRTDDGSLREVRRSELLGSHRAGGRSGSTYMKLAAPIFFAAMAQNFAHMLVKPLRRLTRGNPKLEVLGTLRTPKETGEHIAANIERFDSHLARIGFEIPKRTRIIISDRPLVPSLIGPYSMSGRSINIWRGPRPRSLIAMNAVLFDPSGMREPSVIMHERAHSVLHENHSKRAFTNSNQIVQEALADFLAAHVLDDAGIGRTLSDSRGRSLRDLEYRQVTQGISKSIRDATSADPKDDHNNSLLVSNLLWKIRQQIGADQMDKFIHPYIEALNRNYESYGHLIQGEGRESNDHTATVVQTIEYTTAVALKVSRELDLSPEVREQIRKASRDYSRSVLMDHNRITNVSALLIAGEPVGRTGALYKAGESALIHLIGGATLVGEAYLPYNLLF